jgi:hypothetical protein
MYVDIHVLRLENNLIFFEFYKKHFYLFYFITFIDVKTVSSGIETNIYVFLIVFLHLLVGLSKETSIFL